ncbi:hypothetical protein [Leucobacter sp. GX24907]
MSVRVPADRIENIVGQRRHKKVHYGRAVSAEQTVYILHSHECREANPDLRECDYSEALDEGIDVTEWQGFEDEAVVLYIEDGRLLPLGKPRSR